MTMLPGHCEICGVTSRLRFRRAKRNKARTVWQALLDTGWHWTCPVHIHELMKETEL